jgi:4-methoxybenzoate monooxygenase (O-demethylating)
MQLAPATQIDPFSEAFLADPFAFHDELLALGPVFWIEAYQCYGMARHETVQSALKDWETYVSARGVGLSDFSKETPWRPPSLLLEADPPLHDRTRGMMNRIASLNGIKALQGEWQAKADTLIAGLTQRTDIDGVTDIAEAFPLMVFPDLIGLMNEGRENLIPYAVAVFNAFGPRNAIFERANEEAQSATLWVAQACKRPNLKPGGWGMAVYEAADRGECGHDEAERLVRSFLSAGVDTTVNGIANMLLAFAEFPDEWAKLRANPALSKKAIEETMRWGGVAQTFFRTTSRAVDVEGVTIPEGEKVLLFLAAANRDPMKWAEPNRFNIDRMTSGHVGFGFGIHQCLGQMVARYESQCVLDALLKHIGSISKRGEPTYRLNNTLRALESLPLQILPA